MQRAYIYETEIRDLDIDYIKKTFDFRDKELRFKWAKSRAAAIRNFQWQIFVENDQQWTNCIIESIDKNRKISFEDAPANDPRPTLYLEIARDNNVYILLPPRVAVPSVSHSPAPNFPSVLPAYTPAQYQAWLESQNSILSADGLPNEDAVNSLTYNMFGYNRY